MRFSVKNDILQEFYNLLTRFNQIYIIKLFFIANNSVFCNLFVKFLLVCRFLNQ